MDVEELRKLIRLMDEAGLTELEIEDRSGKVRLVRGAARKQRRAADDASSAENGDSSGAFALAGGDAADAGYDERGSETMMRERLASAADGNTVVTSPMVGTFYRSSAPDADPFVATGDVVQPGQVLCIIEAMKMMNEIHAEVGGRIVGITAENGSPVEYGSPLFLIAPVD